MSSITNNDIDKELDLKLTQTVKHENISKDKLIKRILSQAAGLPVEWRNGLRWMSIFLKSKVFLGGMYKQ